MAISLNLRVLKTSIAIKFLCGSDVKGFKEVQRAEFLN